MAYATYQDVELRLNRTFTPDEINLCESLLEDSAVIIDAYNKDADENSKKVVSCQMVVRAIGIKADADVPIGATQGSMSALGYSQSWTLSSGATGELYLSKLNKKLLGIGSKIGAHSVLEDI